MILSRVAERDPELTMRHVALISAHVAKARPLVGRLRADFKHWRSLGDLAIDGVDRDGGELLATIYPARSAEQNLRWLAPVQIVQGRSGREEGNEENPNSEAFGETGIVFCIAAMGRETARFSSNLQPGPRRAFRRRGRAAEAAASPDWVLA